MVKKIQKSGKISKNLKKSHFFKKSENFENIFFLPKKKKKYAIILVLPIEEISLRPELSTPPRFRIQGGSPERDGRRTEQQEILVSNIGLYNKFAITWSN